MNGCNNIGGAGCLVALALLFLPVAAVAADIVVVNRCPAPVKVVNLIPPSPVAAAPVYRVEYFRDGRGRLYQRLVMDAPAVSAQSPCVGGVCPLPRR